MTYLQEVLKGNYGNKSEDRLSQIFSASFNSSAIFRREVCKFTNIKYRKNLKCKTQVCFNKNYYRIDILIKDKKNRLVIESKTDSKLTKKQLDNYEKIKEINNTEKACFIKSYENTIKYPKNWTIYYWSDFYQHINDIKNKDFFIEQFIEVLMDFDMKKIEKITVAELKQLSKTFYHIRYNDKPQVFFDKPIFETVENYRLMLEDIYYKISKNEIITRSIGKRIKYNPWIGSWWNNADEKKKYLWIGWEIKLSKEINSISKLGSALLLEDKEEEYHILTYVSDKHENFIKQVEYPKDKNLLLRNYQKQVISSWEKWLKI